jgi:enediyne biosynthesis protein E4
MNICKNLENRIYLRKIFLILFKNMLFMKSFLTICFILCFILFNAQEEIFYRVESRISQINFSNNIIENNLVNIYTYEYLYNGAGVAAGDFNNDGLTDLYFVSNMEDNHLYLNQGNFHFKDITYTAKAQGEPGYSTGVTTVDINNDGFLDIYICKSVLNNEKMRENELLINNGDLTFTNKAKEYGLNDASYSSQAYFFDMDLDGDLDLFLLNHPINLKESNKIKVRKDEEGNSIFYTANDLTYISDKIYRNDGGKFVNISKEAGIQNESFGLSAVISDFNGDNFPDIYVCNDFVMPDNLYINNGKGQFVDSFAFYFQHSSFSSMGSDYADINNDGHPDLITLDMVPRDNYRQKTLAMEQNYDKYLKMLDVGLKAQFSTNVLQLNNGNGSFSDIAQLAGVAYTDWSWTPLFADFDNDGWKDLFISNGLMRDITNNDYRKYVSDSIGKLSVIGTDYIKIMESIPSNKVSSYLFKNNKNLTFSDYSKEWNSGPPAFSTGSIYVDLNNDGLLDLVTNNINDEATILMNSMSPSSTNNFIRIKLKDPSNKSVYGTKVKVYDKLSYHLKRPQFQEYYPTRGYLSSVEPVLHFGMGNRTMIEKIEVEWPDGSTQIYYDVPANQLYEIIKNPQELEESSTSLENNVFFEDKSLFLHQEMYHEENDYIDFKNEPLLIQKFSEEGPAVAVGDVNNDGLDDVFIGGAKGIESKLFIQAENGKFEKSKQRFLEGIESEDVNALFFDINRDGFVDLYVACGGNEYSLNAKEYKDRVYINDKKGNLIYKADASPNIYQSTCALAVHDMDGDGDLDLFVGGRVSPKAFPLSPKSYILRNDKGIFTDVTEKWSVDLSEIGMVTDATFADLNLDGNKELIVVGEWMPVSVFEFVKNKFRNKTEEYGLEKTQGLWRSITISDINGDSIPDILAGNLGTNSFFKASESKPFEIHYGDFDGNGLVDPIFTMYNEDKPYLLHYRDRVLEQLPSKKKKYLRYDAFANETIETFLTPEEFSLAKRLFVNQLESSIFYGSNMKKFTKVNFPVESQFSTVNTTLVMERNSTKQILQAGNFFGTDAQFGRFDASSGVFYKMDNYNNFIKLKTNTIDLRGDVRKVLPLQTKTGTNLLVTKNNDYFKMYKIIKD